MQNDKKKKQVKKKAVLKPSEKRVVSQATKRLMRRAMTKYKQSFCGEIIEWFSSPKDNDKWQEQLDVQTVVKGQTFDHKIAVYIPTLTGFCDHIGCSLPTLYKWVDTYDEFADAYEEAMEIKRELINQYAMRGAIDGTFAKYMLESWKPRKSKQRVESENRKEDDGTFSDGKVHLKITVIKPPTLEEIAAQQASEGGAESAVVAEGKDNA